MSSNKFLTQLLSGDGVRDYDHASRTFRDDNYALQPRHKHLFHVVFNFAPGVTQSDGFLLNSNDRGNLHLLVKNVDLPGFDIDVTDKNQYNRHRYTHHRMNYAPVNIVFHDDQSDLIRKLWYSYYNFYFQDPAYQNSGGGLARAYTVDDVYTDSDARQPSWGLDRGPMDVNGKKFFSDIRIYSMYQKKYMDHVLVNPIITSFKHDKHDYADGGIMEHNMVVNYESVKYDEGHVTTDNPANFAAHHYDTTPSPITPAGGAGVNSIFGPSGLIDAVNGVSQDLADGDLLGGIFTAARVIENSKGRNLGRIIKQEGQQAVKDFLRGKNPLANKRFPRIPKGQ